MWKGEDVSSLFLHEKNKKKDHKLLIDEYEVKVFSPKKPSKNEMEQEKQNIHFEKQKIHSPLPKSPYSKPLTKNRDSPAKKKVKKKKINLKIFSC